MDLTAAYRKGCARTHSYPRAAVSSHPPERGHAFSTVSPIGYVVGMDEAPIDGITWVAIDWVSTYLAMSGAQVGRLVRNHGLPCRDFGGVRRYPMELVITWAESDIVLGGRSVRSRREDAGRPAVRGSRRGMRSKTGRNPAKTWFGVAPMPG
jgi:hypothetical protein